MSVSQRSTYPARSIHVVSASTRFTAAYQSHGKVARVSMFAAVVARRPRLVAFDLARLARPAAISAAALGFCGFGGVGGFFLRARHGVVCIGRSMKARDARDAGGRGRGGLVRRSCSCSSSWTGALGPDVSVSVFVLALDWAWRHANRAVVRRRWGWW